MPGTVRCIRSRQAPYYIQEGLTGSLAIAAYRDKIGALATNIDLSHLFPLSSQEGKKVIVLL